MRTRLPETRNGWTHKVVIQSVTEGRVKLFFTVNEYPDTGKPAKLFVHADESGCLLDGFCDAWATDFSLVLQHGDDARNLLLKHAWADFEPKGLTDDPEIRFARSIPDYICRKMAQRYQISLEGK